MPHKPKYDWGKLWSGMEQVHDILTLLMGLYWVGSTDPVADAVAMGKDRVLREAVAKVILDNIIYPVAISLDRQQELMRVRRHMKPDEVETWLRRRGYRFATTEELHQFLENSQFWGGVTNFSSPNLRSGSPRYSELGYTIEKGIHDRASGCESIDCYMPDMGFILAAKDADIATHNISPTRQDLVVAVEPIGQCKLCGVDISGWTGECPRHGVLPYWPKA